METNFHQFCCLGIHTGERNFGCEICGQRFRAKGTLKGHILTHTGERPFSMYLISIIVKLLRKYFKYFNFN